VLEGRLKMNEAKSVRRAVVRTHGSFCEQLDEEVDFALGAGLERDTSWAAAAAPEGRTPSPPPAIETPAQIVEPGKVALGEEAVHVGDCGAGPCCGNQPMQEPRVVTAEAAGSEESAARSRILLPLAPEAVNPAAIVDRVDPAERASAAPQRFDNVVGEDVWQRPRLVDRAL